MDKLSKAQSELLEMDALAAHESPIHSMHPLAKFLVTIIYIYVVVSFPKYNFSGLVAMVLYPVLVYQVADVPLSLCFRKLRFILPLVLAVGIANPFLDNTPFLQIGGTVITGGIVSMVTLMMKGTFSLMASFILVATTKIDSLCAALRKLHVPDTITTLLLLTYRYIGVMIEEVSIMSQAYKLRAPGQNGIHISAWGSFLGQLLLRSMDRAEELYSSMQLRGFKGEFYYADVPSFDAKSILYTVGLSGLFILFRFVNVASLFGGLFV